MLFIYNIIHNSTIFNVVPAARLPGQLPHGRCYCHYLPQRKKRTNIDNDRKRGAEQATELAQNEWPHFLNDFARSKFDRLKMSNHTKYYWLAEQPENAKRHKNNSRLLICLFVNRLVYHVVDVVLYVVYAKQPILGSHIFSNRYVMFVLCFVRLAHAGFFLLFFLVCAVFCVLCVLLLSIYRGTKEQNPEHSRPTGLDIQSFTVRILYKWFNGEADVRRVCFACHFSPIKWHCILYKSIFCENRMVGRSLCVCFFVRCYVMPQSERGQHFMIVRMVGMMRGENMLPRL